MIATARALKPSRSPLGAVLDWTRLRPWVFAYAVLSLWALVPEVRRLIDFRFGYNSISLISIIPLVSLLPFGAALLYVRARTLDRGMAICGWLWFGGFTFSFAVGLATGDKLATTYAFVGFVLPALLGLWLAKVDAPAVLVFDKISAFLLWLATPIALYGAFQFVSPPAWDRDWMLHAHITAIGLPEPFLLRPFSTLNSPGPFADFLVAVLLLNLPRLGRIKPVQIVQLTLILATLVLTMVRSSWLACALGIFAYIVMSPKPGRNLTIFAGIGILGAFLIFNASSLLGSAQAGQDLSRRFGTLTDLSNDDSYTNRQQYLGTILDNALLQPIGQGLGVVGTAAKLSSNQTVDFDNGYVARLVEMGYFGTACYLATLGAGLVLAFRFWRRSRCLGFDHGAAIGASIFAVQLALVGLDVANDHHNDFSGIIFWLTLGIVSRHSGLLAEASTRPTSDGPGRREAVVGLRRR